MTGRAPPRLDAAALARVAEAIRVAEASTAGEIVVIVAARAGLYRSVALGLALLVGLVAPWPLIALTGLGPAAIALVQAVAVLAVLLATLDARVRLRLVPRVLGRWRAHEAARRAFGAHGLSRTRGRTGVLIYVALAERYAEIVADAGVAARVPVETWRGTIAALVAAAGRGELGPGLVAAVEAVGAILAAEVPPTAEDRDELPNRVIVLDA